MSSKMPVKPVGGGAAVAVATDVSDANRKLLTTITLFDLKFFP